MARLASDANLNYVALPESAAQMIRSYLDYPESSRVLDPCAGEGKAITDITRHATCDVYLNELHDTRRVVCRTLTPFVLGADTLLSLKCSKHMFGLVYCNPPFTNTGKEQGGGRAEHQFFAKIENAKWLQVYGIAIYVAPEDIVLRTLAINHLVRSYDAVRIYRLPDDIRAYREVVVFGVQRPMQRLAEEFDTERTRILSLFDDLPVLSLQDTPLYTIPSINPIAPLIWRDTANATPEQAMNDVIQTGGAWTSTAYKRKKQEATQDRIHIRPLFPLSKTQAALRIAAGAINGQVVSIGGKHAMVKGTTVIGEHKTVVQDDEKTETRSIVTRTPYIVTIDVANGNIGQYTGDEGMAKLMEHPDTAHNLIDAATKTAPPLYDMTIPEPIQAILDTLKPVSGRHLPGYEPGLIPMQQHCVAAIMKGFETYRQTILSAEMGAGKSSMAVVLAELLYRLKPTNKNRAFTTIVVAPNHLISDENWLGEWKDLLPHWHMQVLETPAQVATFFRYAETSDHPCVGFMTLSKMRDASGRVISAVRGKPFPHDSDNTARGKRYKTLKEHTDLDQKRTQFYDAHRAERRKRMGVAQADSSEQTGATRIETPTDLPIGVSKRTIQRDKLLRCGKHTRHQNISGHWYSGALWHYDNLFCPDCGRVLAQKNGAPYTESSLYSAGLIQCLHCGATLGQMARKQDSVGDRSVFPAIFPHPDLPFGTIPTSNPRIPLGYLIAKRYAGKVDMLIADEVHKMKASNSEVGRIFGMLVQASHRTLGLTGTLYGGKASTVFSLLYRLNNPHLMSLYRWEDETTFVKEMGVVETITREYESKDDAKVMSGKGSRVYTQTRERAGITPDLAAIVQSQSVMVLLKHMGFHLAPYSELVHFLELPGHIQESYEKLVEQGKDILQDEDGGWDAMGSYLQATLTYPVAPWHPLQVRSRRCGRTYTVQQVEPDAILPHHEFLRDHILTGIEKGHRTLIYVEHTGKWNIQDDLARKLIQLDSRIRPAILSTTKVKSDKRAAWFRHQEESGTNVVICHPKLVETGMNLIGWPDIVFLEPSYGLYVALQARKRALRPTQTKPCTVTWLGYSNTMMADALDVIASKALAASLLTGDDLSSGLMQIQDSGSLLAELAKRVKDDTHSFTSDVMDKIARLNTQPILQSDLVGVSLPEPTRKPVDLTEWRKRKEMEWRKRAEHLRNEYQQTSMFG